MALILREVFEATREKFQLELIAGRAGLDRPMNWVYVSEDYTTSDFLHGGELIITTGVISGGSSQWLLRLLRHITQQHTCGLIINQGPYLRREQISQEVLDFCDAYPFPLFLMPWQIHIYDITRDYCDRIFTDTRRSESLQQGVLTLLDPAGDHAAALRGLERQGFPVRGGCRALLLRAGRPLPDPDRLSLLTHRLPCPVILLPWQGELLLVCAQSGEDRGEACARLLLREFSLLCPGGRPAVGVSGACPSLAELHRGVEQARAALCFALSQGTELGHYDRMGFFRLLLEVGDRAFLEDYVREQLGPVLDYDRKHGSDFARTLSLYLSCRGSIQAVAEASFCHRNTVNHRVHLLREKLGFRLDDPEACFQLAAAFRAREYLDFTAL